MSYSDPIGFSSATDLNAIKPPQLTKAQLHSQLDSAENGADLITAISNSGVAPSLTDAEAHKLAATPESNNGEYTASKSDAIRGLENTLGYNFAESLSDATPDVKTIAAHLSATEINSAGAAALFHHINQHVQLVNEGDTETATASAAFLQEVHDHFASGGAIDSEFLEGSLNESIKILSVAAITSSQTQFLGFFDPTDPNSQRQLGDVLVTDSAMQDSE